MIPTSTTPPLFCGTGSFRPLSQPLRREIPFLPAPTTPGDVLCAAFTAESAIERIHDLTSMETASQALLNYEKVLLDASPETQLEARQQAFEEGLAIPTVFSLLNAYTTAWKRLYLTIHAANLPLDPAI